MKYIPFFLILLLSVASCRNENDLKADGNAIEKIAVLQDYSNKLPFSSFVDTIELIPLETTKENLIGEITRIVFSGDKYYIRSTNSMQNGKLFVFDQTGKYIKQIGKRGNAPDAYIEFKDFIVVNGDEVVIADYQRWLRYDLEGNFQGSTKVPFSAREILPTKENGVLAFHSLPVLAQNHLLSKVDKDGVQSLFFDRGEAAAVKCGLLTTWHSFVSTDSCYYLKYPFGDTIYAISPDLEKVSTPYYIDYGKKRLPNIKVSPDETVPTWDRKLKHVDDYWEVASIGIGNDFVYLGITDKAYNGYLTLYSPRTKKTMTARKLVDDMFLKENVIPITAKRIPHNMDNNDILWEVEPSLLLEGYERFMGNSSASEQEEFKRQYPEWHRICISLKEDDNPVLLRIKVKL